MSIAKSKVSEYFQNSSSWWVALHLIQLEHVLLIFRSWAAEVTLHARGILFERLFSLSLRSCYNASQRSEKTIPITCICKAIEINWSLSLELFQSRHFQPPKMLHIIVDRFSLLIYLCHDLLRSQHLNTDFLIKHISNAALRILKTSLHTIFVLDFRGKKKRKRSDTINARTLLKSASPHPTHKRARNLTRSRSY